MTLGSLRSRDQRKWLAAAAVSMIAVTGTDTITGDRFDVPVAGAIVGPMIAAIACTPLVVSAMVGVAAVVRLGLDIGNGNIASAQTTFNLAMVLLLGTIAVVASTVRHRRDRELAVTRPAQRLTSMAAALAAARSVEEIKEAFTRLARAELGATWVRFLLVRGEADVPAADDAAYAAALVVASGDLGRVEIWFDETPDAQTVAVLDEAVAQVSVALGRAESARSLAVTARRLSALQRSTSQLAGLLRTADIARSMVTEVRHALQADRAIFSAIEDGVVRVWATDGATTAREGDEIRVAVRAPVTDVIRTRSLVVHESEESAEAEYGHRPAGADGLDRSFIVAPVVASEEVVATVHVGFDQAHHVDEEERRLLDALVTLVGSAWRRAARFEEEERERAGSVHRAERAARLATLAATLADARDRSAVAAAFAEHGLTAADATWGAVFELDAARRSLRVLPGRPSSVTWSAGTTISLDREMALTAAVREMRPFTMGTREEVVDGHPGEDVNPAQHARAAIPLLSYGRAIGAIGFGWDRPHAFDAGEIEYLQTIATRTSEALERGRLHEAEREDERRWNLLAEASARLAHALEPRDVIGALVRWAVPLVADSCTVYLSQDGGTARPYVSVDLPQDERAAELFGSERIDLASDHPIARLYRLRQPLLVEDLPEEVIADAVGRDPQRLLAVRRLGIRHVLAAPLIARNQQIGVLVLTMGRSERSFAPADVELVGDLAARFAIVYDNAVLFATERNITARLQAALLPTTLDPPRKVEVAVRYSASGSRAGGDWYDLIRFDDDSAALVVGDLVGHGVEAAATMSRYRSALRAHARMHEDPGEVMNAYSEFIDRDEAGQTATVLYCRIDAGPGGGALLSYCSAGHPPPIVRSGGRTTVLPSPQGPLIGLVCGGYRTNSTELGVGDLVVLYTDGLLERRGESLDQGTQRLEAFIANLPCEDLEQFVEDLLVAMRDDHHDDDIAVLVARVRPFAR